MKASPEFRTFSARIKSASGDAGKLRKLEASTTRVYDAGCMTPGELSRLDGMIMTRLAKLETATPTHSKP